MLVCLALFIVFQSIPAVADNFATTFNDPSEVKSGSLLFTRSPSSARTEQTGQYVSATRLNTDVNIQVSGLLVNGEVVQKFRNDTRQWQEALYVFPLPENAAVYGMKIEVNGRVIQSEIQKKATARKTFAKAKQAGKRAALVEQKRPNLFSTAVAHIGPGEEILITIDYSQSLSYRDSGFELRFPTTITPRYIPGAPVQKAFEEYQANANQVGPVASGWSMNTNEVPDASEITPHTVTETDVGANSHQLAMQVTLDPGFPVEAISSATHQLTIQKVGETRIVQLQQGHEAQNRDFVLKWKPAPQSHPQSALFTQFDGQHTYGMVMLLPPEVAPAEVAGKELVLVIDTSGSMGGVSIRQAKQAITRAISSLRPIDHFNIIQFNSTASQLFPGSQPASHSNKAMATHYVSQLQANGGTEMAKALDLALVSNRANTEAEHSSGLRQVVFITDGSVGNENALFDQIQHNLTNSRLFTVGIGPAPNSHFMRKAAAFGRGTFTHIDHTAEVETGMDTLLRKIQYPALNNIQIEWADQVEAEVYPEKIADLYLGEPVVFSFRIKGDQASGRITGRGLANQPGENKLWQRELTVNADQTEKAEQKVMQQGLDRHWARQNIDSLMNQWNDPAQQSRIENEVTETALTHKLVTQFTSLVAVDKTPVRSIENVGSQEESNQSAIPVLLPKGLPSEMLHYPQTATPANLYLVIGLILLACALPIQFRQLIQQRSERGMA